MVTLDPEQIRRATAAFERLGPPFAEFRRALLRAYRLPDLDRERRRGDRRRARERLWQPRPWKASR